MQQRKRKRKVMSTAERQRKYREKIRAGENCRIQLVLPRDIAIRIDSLTQALHCNKTQLFAELILDRWQKESAPTPKKKRKRRA